MTELPRGWTTATLQEVSRVILGQSPPGRSYNSIGQGVPFFQGKAEFGPRYPTVVKWTTEPKRFARAGDILLSVRAPVGPTNIAPASCAIGRGLHAIRPLCGIDRDYLLWAIRASVNNMVDVSTGSTFGAVTGLQVKRHKIHLAPSVEQVRIAARIEEIFAPLDYVEVTLTSLLDTLNQLWSSILADAFYTNRDLPSDWKRVTIDSVCVINPRFDKSQFPDNLELSFIPMKAVEEKTGQLDTSTARRMYDLRHKSYRGFKEGDILSAKITPSMENGKVALAKDLIGGWGMGSTEFHVLRPNNRVHPWYLTWFLLRDSFRAAAKIHMTGTAGQLRVPAHFLASSTIPLPALKEQVDIVNHVGIAIDRLKVLEELVTGLIGHTGVLRRSVLAEAFAGRLVPQDPNDEPASVLLQRIAASRPAKPARRKARI